MASERVMYWCYIFPFIALITLIVTASIGWDTNSDNIYNTSIVENNTSIVENNTSIVEDDESKYSTVEVDGKWGPEEYFWCSVIFLSLFLLFWIFFYISNKIENIKDIRNAERDRIEAIELQKQESKKRPFIIIKLICIYKSIINDTPEHRALEGIFMSFQYPVIIPGVNNAYFLKAALNAKRKYQGQSELDAVEFLDLIRKKLQIVGMEEKYLHRAVNDGFSGGEKKRNEILQMITLEPSLSILDETDSGLDIDALKIVAEGVNNYRRDDRAIVIITHYQRILRYLEADHVHVLIDGKIAKSGGEELAETLEEKGYGWLDS